MTRINTVNRYQGQKLLETGQNEEDMRGSKIPLTNDTDKYSKQKIGAQSGIYKKGTKHKSEKGVLMNTGSHNLQEYSAQKT